MRFLRMLVMIVLPWQVLPGVVAETPTPGAEGPRVSVDAPDSARFEGYVFRDAEGRPLPFQTDAEIEAFLKNATIQRSEPMPTGITLPHKMLLEADGVRAHAVFKDVDISRRKVTEKINARSRFSLDWVDCYRYDIAAYTVDRLLGMERVPPVVARKIGRDSGAVSIWLTGTVSEVERSQKWKVDPPDRQRWNGQRLMLQVFDNLVANRDSNLGNLLIDGNWRLWFIDCTRCFGTTEAMYYPLDTISKCERNLWRGLQDLDDDKVRERLAPFLSRKEIGALLARRDTLVRHFQKLIEERGESSVLYSVDPPSETAPWAED